MNSNARIASIEIDDKSLAPAGPDAEHERKVAIFDLIESNSFKVIGHEGGPYNVVLSLADNRLVFEISEQDGSPVRKLLLSLTALPMHWRPETRFLSAWNLGVLLYIASAIHLMLTADPARMRRLAQLTDESRFVVLVLAIFAAMASIVAIIA
jgi:hypothetical protein